MNKIKNNTYSSPLEIWDPLEISFRPLTGYPCIIQQVFVVIFSELIHRLVLQ